MGFIVTDQEKIDEILDNFDFELVHRAMLGMNWTWNSCDCVPNIADLRKKARELLKELITKDLSEIGTGGLRAEKRGDFLRLTFVVADWEVESENNLENARQPSNHLHPEVGKQIEQDHL